MVKTFLITGGNGFIGINLIKYIIKKNKFYHIRIIDNLSSSKFKEIKKLPHFFYINDINKINIKKKGIFFLKKSILQQKYLDQISKKIDCVIHLAANTGIEKSINNPRYDLSQNVLGSMNILESCKKNGVKKIIFASSNAAVGENSSSISETIYPKPNNLYGASKLSGESYMYSYYKTHNLNTVSLRFGNVYGPGSDHKNNIIPTFIKNLINNKICFINGDGKQTRDFIFISDLVEAIYKCTYKNNLSGELFQIASGKQTSINKLAKIILDKFQLYTKKKGELKYRSKRIGDVYINYSNIKKAKKILKWYPKIKLEKGIELTLKYFINEKNY